MAVTVNFYSFAKRTNSTKQPAVQPALVADCYLKDDVSIINPVLTVHTSASPVAYNYAYIPDFNRYYFVSDWTISGNLWQASLMCDVLGSFKTAVGASSQYVTRSASQSDGTILDEFYPTKNVISNETKSLTSPFDHNFNTGCYIVSVIGGYSGSVGGVTYYIMEASNFATFVRYLMSDSFLGTQSYGEEITDDLVKAVMNPFQYITGAMWFPVDPTDSGVWPSVAIKVGWWTLPTTWGGYSMDAYILDATSSGIYSILSSEVAVPRHPQASTRGVYLNGAPYSRYILHYGPFGDISLDPTRMVNVQSDKLLFNIRVDLITGQGLLTIYNGATILESVRTQVGVPVAVSSLGQMANGIQLMTGAAGSAAKKVGDYIGGLGSMFKDVVNTIGSVATMMEADPETKGSTGSMIDYQISCGLQGIFVHLVDENNSEYGRPLCTTKTINTLSGYIVCGNPEIEITGATSAEVNQIVNYMGTGFFYE